MKEMHPTVAAALEHAQKAKRLIQTDFQAACLAYRTAVRTLDSLVFENQDTYDDEDVSAFLTDLFRQGLH